MFDINWSSTQYRLFANCKPDGSLDDYAFGVDDVVLPEGTITLESGVEIASVNPNPSASILFIPPTPLIFIKPGDPLNARVFFQRADGVGTAKILEVTSRGVIDID